MAQTNDYRLTPNGAGYRIRLIVTQKSKTTLKRSGFCFLIGALGKIRTPKISIEARQFIQLAYESKDKEAQSCAQNSLSSVSRKYHFVKYNSKLFLFLRD